MLIALYLVAALTAALAAYYGIKNLPADLVLLGANALITLVWAIAATYFLIRSTGNAITDPITFWGYILTGLTLPLAGLYLGFIERTRWGSLGIGAIALTCIFLAMRLPQIWPAGF